jgi:putative DNA primase/helicase
MDFPEKRKILDPWLSEQTLVLVPGWRGIGKTWFGLGVADAITRGIGFGPWDTITSVPCLYIDGEMAVQDIKERVEALASSTEEKRKEPLLIYSDFYGNSLGIPKANLLNHKWRAAIKEIALDWSIKLLVLDNLSSLCPGIDENSKLEWDPVNQWLLDLRFSGLSVIMLHHTNKEGGQRGTSGREDNIDISIHLTQPADYVPEDGCRFILKFSKARIRTADLQLIQDTEFQLKEVNGRMEWNYSGTKKKNKAEVLRLLSEKVPQKEISEALGLSKGRVSQIRISLVEDDYLSGKGELTIKGEAFLRGN